MKVTNSYTQSMSMLLVAIFIPTTALTRFLWPREWRQIFRGGEVAICFAFALDAGLRLLYIGLGNPVPYPGFVTATVLLSSRAFVALLLWGRVSQAARHHLKSKEAQRIGIEMLRDAGKDVSKYEKKRFR